MDLRQGVASRLAGLSLTRRGRLAEVRLCSDAVHCGLLVDLVLSGRLQVAAETVVVDGTVTGFAPADELSALILAEPGRRLVDWVEDERLGLAEVADALVSVGAWTRTRRLLRGDRYVVADEDRRRRDLALAGVPDDGAAQDRTAADAAVVALAGTAAMLGEARDRGWGRPADPVTQPVLAATGSARTTCEASIAYLAWARQWRRYAVGVLGAGNGTPG